MRNVGGLQQCLTVQNTVNLGDGGSCVVEDGGSARDLTRHPNIVADARQPSHEPSKCKHEGNILIASITKRMVKNLSRFLGRERWVADNVNDWDILRVRATNTAKSTQLSRAKGGDQGSGSLDAGIPISSIGTDKLIGRADPGNALGLDLIEKSELKVWRRQLICYSY